MSARPNKRSVRNGRSALLNQNSNNKKKWKNLSYLSLALATNLSDGSTLDNSNLITKITFFKRIKDTIFIELNRYDVLKAIRSVFLHRYQYKLIFSGMGPMD